MAMSSNRSVIYATMPRRSDECCPPPVARILRRRAGPLRIQRTFDKGFWNVKLFGTSEIRPCLCAHFHTLSNELRLFI